MSVLIDNNTKVICQSFTGKSGAFYSQAAIGQSYSEQGS